MSVKDKVRNYILENYLFTDDQSELDDNASFLDKGIIDSTGILELVMFIEEEFNIQLNDEDMIPENLDSVENIVNFVTIRSE